MYRYRQIDPGFSWLKFAEAFQIAGGVGALIMPFIGYATAWVSVHGKTEFQLCENSKLAEEDAEAGIVYNRFVLANQQIYYYVYLMLYCFLLVKPFHRYVTNAVGILFAVWMTLGFVCAIVNIIITATTECIHETAWGSISKAGCFFIIIQTVLTGIAALVMICKWARAPAGASVSAENNKVSPTPSKQPTKPKAPAAAAQTGNAAEP